MAGDAVLVLNAGSSSLKYRLTTPDGQRLADGTVERIGEDGGDASDHGHAVHRVVDGLRERSLEARVAAVGHRVVHGADRFRQPVRVDDAVLSGIEEL